MDPARLLDGRLKIRHLTLLTTIAREGTLLRAAKVLHVSQPVVTRSLHELESVLEAELFVRGSRGVTPTAAGEVMIEHAHRILGTISSAGTKISHLQRDNVEPVRVGTNLAGAYALMPRALVALKRSHPHLTVSVVEDTYEHLATALRHNELDLVVGRLQSLIGTDEHDLRRVRLYDEPVRLVARRGHPALDNTPVALEQLLKFPWVLPNAPSALRSAIDELFESKHLALPTNIIECSTVITLKGVLLKSDAISPLPAMIGIETPELEVLDTELEAVPVTIGITTSRAVDLTPSAMLMTRSLVNAAKDLRAELTRQSTRHQTEPACDKVVD